MRPKPIDRTPKPIDPATDAEWEEAASAARTWRLMHNAFLYGLISDPGVNVERCDWIIAEYNRRLGRRE